MPSVTDKRSVWSYLGPLCQNESSCESLHIKMCSACRFIFIQIKLIFVWNVLRKDSFWNKGTRELWTGLFSCCFCCFFLNIKLESTVIIIFLKDFEQENDNEETEEAEEEESRDLSRWNVTIPHVIMETKQVIVNFAQVVYLHFSKYLNKNLVTSCRILGTTTHRYLGMCLFFVRRKLDL